MKTRILFIALMLLGTAQINAQTIMNIHQNNGTVLQIPLNTIDSITYTIPNPGNLATITTLPAESITETSVVTGGNISNNGGTPITQRGVCWSTNPNPTTADNTINEGNGTGSYNSNITGLTDNTLYYVRAYAINGAGTSYGNTVSFTTTSGDPIISDPGPGVTFNGYTYSSVILGNGQEWMAENLRTTQYANGDPVPNVTDSNQWSTLITGAWSHYSNNSQNENPNGKLYNWYAIDDSRNVCPTGWHVPSDAEWTLLTDYLGGEAVAGGKMKSTGTEYWSYPNTDATNESGFSGIASGFRSANGPFSNDDTGFWWSSTENDADVAWYRYLHYYYGDAFRDSENKKIGYSVRCLKD